MVNDIDQLQTINMKILLFSYLLLFYSKFIYFPCIFQTQKVTELSKCPFCPHALSFVESYRGKFGQVFKLVEKSTKKVWAGKFIKAFSAKEKENVRQEIGIMNSLHHPKLVQCVDAFEGKSDMVMVMEL